MAQLRRKLEPDPARPRWLLTEPGMGYRFQPDPEAGSAAAGDEAAGDEVAGEQAAGGDVRRDPPGE
jgi:hypothetical protein